MLKVRKIRGYIKFYALFPKATTNAPQKCRQGIKPVLANLLCQPIINVASQNFYFHINWAKYSQFYMIIFCIIPLKKKEIYRMEKDKL